MYLAVYGANYTLRNSCNNHSGSGCNLFILGIFVCSELASATLIEYGLLPPFSKHWKEPASGVALIRLANDIARRLRRAEPLKRPRRDPDALNDVASGDRGRDGTEYICLCPYYRSYPRFAGISSST